MNEEARRLLLMSARRIAETGARAALAAFESILSDVEVPVEDASNRIKKAKSRIARIRQRKDREDAE